MLELSLIFISEKVHKMAHLVLQNVILSDAQTKDLRETRNLRRIARYADKALAMNDDEFKRSYRVTKAFFHELCQELEPLMQTPKRKSDISTKYKVIMFEIMCLFVIFEHISL